jgi:hypothetical protein
MKTDLYTKIVLTVIAMCLVWLSADRLFRPSSSYAQRQQLQRVVLVGFDWQDEDGESRFIHLGPHGPLPVNMVKPGGR